MDKIKKTIRLVNNVERDGDVQIKDNTWAYLVLWRNREGIINYQRALKFATEYRDDERGVAVSSKQRRKAIKSNKWLTNELSKLTYEGKPMDWSIKWGWIDWTKACVAENNRAVQRGKGGRLNYKYCLIADE